MNLDNHESAIKNKMLQHREVIDPNEVWQDLEPQLHPKKKRRVIFFWLFGGLGLTLLSTIWLTQSAQQHNTLADKSDDRTTLQESKHTANQSSGDAKNKLESKLNSAVAPLLTSSAISTGANSPVKNIPNTSPIAINNTPSETSNNQNNTSNSKASNSFETENNQTRTERNLSPAAAAVTNSSSASTLATNNASSKTTDKQKKSNDIIAYKSSENIQIKQPNKSDFLIDNKKFETTASPITNTRLSSDHIKTIQSSSALTLLSKMPVLLLSPLNINELATLDIPSNITSKIIEPAKKSNKKIDLFTSFGWGNFKSTYTSFDGDDQEYIDQLNQINEGISSQHVKLGLRYNFKDWYLESGIDYNRFASRTKLYQVSTIDTMINGTQATYYKRSGAIEVTEGNVPAVNQITQDIQWHTYRHLIDLPISIGYEKDIQRFSFGVQAGISINLSQGAEGAYISQGGRLIKFNATSSQNPYQTNYGVSYTGGLHVAYHFNPSMSLRLSGNYRSFPTRTIQFEQRIKENIKSGQLSMGVLYRL